MKTSAAAQNNQPRRPDYPRAVAVSPLYGWLRRGGFFATATSARACGARTYRKPRGQENTRSAAKTQPRPAKKWGRGAGAKSNAPRTRHHHHNHQKRYAQPHNHHQPPTRPAENEPQRPKQTHVGALAARSGVSSSPDQRAQTARKQARPRLNMKRDDIPYFQSNPTCELKRGVDTIFEAKNRPKTAPNPHHRRRTAPHPAAARVRPAAAITTCHVPPK